MDKWRGIDMEKEHRGLPCRAAVPSTGETLRANALSDCIMPISDRAAVTLHYWKRGWIKLLIDHQRFAQQASRQQS